MRLRVDPVDGTLVEVSFRNGFVVGYPQSSSETVRDDLMRTRCGFGSASGFARRCGSRAASRRAERSEAQGRAGQGPEVPLGSCGRDQVVNLNWHLVFAPKTVLEYAVVHELCHLRHRNHDKDFWRSVGTILPDWEARKAWLDGNEHFLTLRRVEPS